MFYIYGGFQIFAALQLAWTIYCLKRSIVKIAPSPRGIFTIIGLVGLSASLLVALFGDYMVIFQGGANGSGNAEGWVFLIAMFVFFPTFFLFSLLSLIGLSSPNKSGLGTR